MSETKHWVKTAFTHWVKTFAEGKKAELCCNPAFVSLFLCCSTAVFRLILPDI